MKETLFYSIRPEMAGLFLTWAGTYAWLLFSGRYLVFLRPGFWILLLAALCISCAFLTAVLFRALSPRAFGPGAKVLVRMGVLMLPLLYLVVAQQEPLGSHAFKNRSANPAIFRSIAESKTSGAISKDGRITLLELLLNFKAYRGKRITTEGMVYRDETTPAKHFLVFRFLIVCCAADALPASVLVESDQADTFAVDSWVCLEGILDLKVVDGLVFPLIKANKITSIEVPALPYLYPILF